MKNGLDKLTEKSTAIIGFIKYQKTNFINCFQVKKMPFLSMYQTLPQAISDYLSKRENEKSQSNSALEEITENLKKSKRSILKEITFEDYSYYLGFDKLK